jgi:hypothetical protein
MTIEGNPTPRLPYIITVNGVETDVSNMSKHDITQLMRRAFLRKLEADAEMKALEDYRRERFGE